MTTEAIADSIPFDIEAPRMGAGARKLGGGGVWLLPTGHILDVTRFKQDGTHDEIVRHYFPEAAKGEAANRYAWSKGWARVNILPGGRRVGINASGLNRAQKNNMLDWAIYHDYEIVLYLWVPSRPDEHLKPILLRSRS